MDEWIGRLLDTLATLGRLEDTVVMFTSDHGTELLDHDRFGKSAPALHPYTTQPQLAGTPSVSRRRRPGADDLCPRPRHPAHTALDMLDIAEPERDDTAAALAGSSVWPLIRAAGGEAVPSAAVAAARSGRDHVITGWGSYASVRDRQWNYIVDCERPDEDTRLFDVVKRSRRAPQPRLRTSRSRARVPPAPRKPPRPRPTDHLPQPVRIGRCPGASVLRLPCPPKRIKRPASSSPPERMQSPVTPTVADYHHVTGGLFRAPIGYDKSFGLGGLGSHCAEERPPLRRSSGSTTVHDHVLRASDCSRGDEGDAGDAGDAVMYSASSDYDRLAERIRRHAT